MAWRSVLPFVTTLTLAACSQGGFRGGDNPPADGGSDGAGASCHNGRRDGNETDLDCGGPDCSPCSAGRMCLHPSDCVSRGCYNNVCVTGSGHCANGVQDADETDVDCGGPTCTRCGAGLHCTNADDCSSNQCSGDVCQPGGPDMLPLDDGGDGGDGGHGDGGRHDGGDGGRSDGGDGGFIDDGFIDGGFIDGGFIDGGRPRDGGVIDLSQDG